MDDALQRRAVMYIQDPTDRNREELSRVAMPIARSIGKKMGLCRGLPSIAFDQIESDSMMGLVQAINRWDPDLSPEFGAFLHQRVKSCVLDGFRRSDHLARSHRAQLRATGGEDAPIYQAALSLHHRIDHDVDTLLIDQVSEEMEDVVDGERAQLREQVDAILPLMQDLQKFRPNHYKAVCIFVTGETAASLAEELGVTESRVSQLRWEGVNMIKRALEGETIKPPKKGRGKPCMGPGCKKRRPAPTGRRGRPSLYCSDECRENAKLERTAS